MNVAPEAQNAALRAKMLQELADLDEGDVLGSGDGRTVRLDQQSVGRLSRMDVLRRQATRRRRKARRSLVLSALLRMHKGDHGYCEDCGEAIAAARLAPDPTAVRCMSCASG